jgi:hypothetical protein
LRHSREREREYSSSEELDAAVEMRERERDELLLLSAPPKCSSVCDRPGYYKPSSCSYIS